MHVPRSEIDTVFAIIFLVSLLLKAGGLIGEAVLLGQAGFFG